MRVKKIELLGFKSFADRTEIHLHPGITCVVGPNGCGKSNISDAIRWVFGERSAKLLRGARMEDVIFSGSDFRKPLGMAEVSLTLDNSDHILAIPYDEVVITRRIDRSGQSQYFINRTQCRLRDILDLILDTGMGSNSYSMIEQGRVDGVINSDPAERRFLIEEAAGISKYKVKKEEALRKLERTEQNLLRIRDIVAEVQRNIQYAEKQARRAERYKVQFEALKKLEIQKAYLDLEELGRERATEERSKQEVLAEQGGIDRRLAEILDREAEEKRLLSQIVTEEQERSRCYYEVRAEAQALTQRKEFQKERVQEARRRLIEIEKERELLTVNLTELEGETEKRGRERGEAAEAEARAQETLIKEEALFEEEEARFKAKQEEGERLKAGLFENASRLAQYRNELNRLRTLLESGKHQEGRRKGSLEKLVREREALESKGISLRQEIQPHNELIDAHRIKFEEAKRKIGGLREELRRAESEIAEEKLKLQEKLSRLRLIEELDESAEAAEERLLATFRSDRLQGKLIRRLREVLQIRSGYEAAVEAVLGAFAQGLIAEDVETAKGLLEEMSETHQGPCGIFVQSLAKPSGKERAKPFVSHPQVQVAVAEVVEIRSGLEALFCPFFENVYVVEEFAPEHLAELLPLLGEARLVTKQGILLGPEARIFFRNGRLSSDQGPFHRKAESVGLREKCTELEEKIRLAEQKRGERESVLISAASEAERFEEEERKYLIEKESTEALLRSLEERLRHIEEEQRVLQLESNDGQGEEERQSTRAGELMGEIESLEAREKELLQSQKGVEMELEKLRRSREAQIHTLVRLRSFLDTQEERRRGAETNATLLKGQIEKVRERLVKLSAEAEELQGRFEGIEKEEKSLEGRGEELEREEGRASEALTEIRGKRAFQEEALRRLTAQASEVKETLGALREGIHRSEMKLMDLGYRERNVFERLEQTYSVKLADLRKEEFLSESPDRNVIEEGINQLKERVEAFGPVNLLAVEEYEELKQRFEFLSGQERDLIESKETLLEAVRKINRTTKTLFEETFVKARTLFQEYYTTLFGGGQADLVLVEGEEGEDPGIDILVRPPGKKPQHISLLSGGEKSLTAIALLFALFRIKPSPMCVLDEVDAALDEANVDRFLTVLRTFLDASQFVVVTHNRKTIATGNYLYGVTMEESGVSKLVSVRVAEAPEQAAVPGEEEKAVA
jgi:chromosome segregation protein